MCQRRCGAKKIFNFPIYHIASHFTHFQGIFNPLFEVKYKKNFSNPEQKTVTPLAYLFLGFILKKNPLKYNINTHKNNEYTLFVKYLGLKNQAQIQIFESTT